MATVRKGKDVKGSVSTAKGQRGAGSGVVRKARTSKTQPLSEREARKQAVDMAAEVAIALHLEALKELERY